MPMADIITTGKAGLTPNLKMKRWDGECTLKVTLPMKRATVTEASGKIKWRDANKEVHVYPLKRRILKQKDARGKERKFIQNDEGGFEFEVILKKRPKSNVLQFDLETQGLKFYYQPELTQEEMDAGAFRPENVVGSYAVYHESKQGDYSRLGGKNYRAGKAFHIYRPKVIDALGNEIWGVLNVDVQKGILSVTIDRTWLDNAVYPVSVDPTFGRTDVGGSSGEFLGNTLDGSWATCPSAGSADSITTYVEDSEGATAAFAIYKKSDGSLVGYTEEWLMDWWYGWKTLSIVSGGTLLAIDYGLVVWSDFSYYFYFDTVTDAGCSASATYSYPNFPDPASFTTNNYYITIYCTYTEAPAGQPTQVRTRRIPGMNYIGGV